MDRTIVYPGSIPLDTDLLSTNRNVMVALGALAAATIGPGPVVDGLSVQPAGGLNVTVGPGSFITYGPVDQGAYGSLAADVGDGLVKMGINIAPVTLPLSAPTAAGTVVTFLVQATYQELDINPIVLPYYNAANPSQPFMGAANNGLAQPTLRSQKVALQAKAGAAGPAGANQVPTPDPGWLGLATVTIANGQTTVTSANLAPFLQPSVLKFKLPNMRPGVSQAQVFSASGTFTIPQGVPRLFVTVIGGGGAGGLHATLSSGGGGQGGTARGWLYGLPVGNSVAVTVGGGGFAPTSPGNGGAGGTSSFGPYVSATGGQGGFGGSANIVMAGGLGGRGLGGDIREGGSTGTDAIPIAARGGDGGGNGNGRGTSGYVVGSSGIAPGAGGGGGGCSAPSGAGLGARGGNGAAGIVIVEF